MKNNTDLNQAKELSKILPIESADMYFFKEKDEFISTYGNYSQHVKKCKKQNVEVHPCWSLAALINIMPKKFWREHFQELLNEAKMGDYNLIDGIYSLLLKLHNA